MGTVIVLLPKKVLMRSFVAITIALLTTSSWADQTRSPTQFTKVRDQIQRFIDNGQVPSVSVAVVQNDKLIWAEGFGLADLEQKIPATADTIYRLASISKSFTGTGLMVLKDRGLVDLDAPANEYLPGEKLRAYAGSPDEITLRRLANHTSGLPLHYSFFYPGSQPPPFDVTLRRYGFAYRQPGSYWEYSNLAYGVLDQIIGNVSKFGWPKFMELEVYDRLGMSRTSDHIRPGFESDAATQYGLDVTGRFVAVPHYDFDHPGASAVVSSVNDMARYGRMHMNNGILDDVRVLSEESAIEMRRPTAFSPGRNLGYGVAFNDGIMLGRRTNSSSGGMPGVSTTLRLFPDQKNAIVVLTNGEDHVVTTSVMTAIAKVLYPDGSEEEAASSETGQQNFDPFAGKWSGTVLRDGVAISLAIEVLESGTATVVFDGKEKSALKNLSIQDGQLVGETIGRFVVSHPYQDRSEIYFRLRRDGERLVGRLTATQPAYFALSHWTELTRDQ